MIPSHAIWGSMNLCWCNYFTSFWGWILALGGNLRTQKLKSLPFPSRFFDGSQHLFALQVDAERAERFE